jgi:hypothetical protein
MINGYRDPSLRNWIGWVVIGGAAGALGWLILFLSLTAMAWVFGG